jgi:hypothetical protein
MNEEERAAVVARIDAAWSAEQRRREPDRPPRRAMNDIFRLPPNYDFDNLAIQQAIERFEHKYPIDLSKEYDERILREALARFFPIAPFKIPPRVRELTKAEETAGLMAAFWPIDEKTGKVPEIALRDELREKSISEEIARDMIEKEKRRSKRRAKIAVARYFRLLDEKYPKERVRNGATRRVQAPKYDESIKKALQQFDEVWPEEELARHDPPLTPVEFKVLRWLEYMAYIDRLYDAAVGVRLQRRERRWLQD